MTKTLLMSGAMDVANRLANGPKSLSLIRKAYWKTWSNSYEQQLGWNPSYKNEAGSVLTLKKALAPSCKNVTHNLRVSRRGPRRHIGGKDMTGSL